MHGTVTATAVVEAPAGRGTDRSGAHRRRAADGGANFRQQARSSLMVR